MKGPARRRAGFSLLEVTVGTAAFATIGYVLLVAVKASTDSQAAIAQRASENRVVRSASRALIDELALASDDTITVTSSSGGGTGTASLAFRQRIEDGGTAGFGLMHLGVPRSDWSLVYAVNESGELVRRVTDEQGVVQVSGVVASGLRGAGEDPPGFRVVKAGDLWEITLATEGAGNRDGIEEVFHVRARN